MPKGFSPHTINRQQQGTVSAGNSKYLCILLQISGTFLPHHIPLLQTAGSCSSCTSGGREGPLPVATWGQKGFFLWPQMDLFMWLPSAEPADNPGWQGQELQLTGHTSPPLFCCPSIDQNCYLGSFPHLSFWCIMALAQLLRKFYMVTVGWCTMCWTNSYTWTKKKVLHASKT